MVLIGLLLLAVVFVVLGIVQSSVGWIVASLVASALAAGVMVWSYLQSRKRTGSGQRGPAVPTRRSLGCAGRLARRSGAARAE